MLNYDIICMSMVIDVAKAFTRGGVGVYLSGDGKRKSMPMKLELSSEGRYALRALVYLARDAERGELVTADRISAEAAVPRRLLARVMAKLARAGLVESSEGRGGGSRLARTPEEVTLRDAVEGPFEITHCIMQQRPCGESRPCTLHDAWTEGQNTILDHLTTRTLAEFSSQAPPFPR
jgi:Rrf2 family protein